MIDAMACSWRSANCDGALALAGLAQQRVRDDVSGLRHY